MGTILSLDCFYFGLQLNDVTLAHWSIHDDSVEAQPLEVDRREASVNDHFSYRPANCWCLLDSWK
jgi:hypothetical protein